MARIFISYSTSDPEPAAKIKVWLEDHGFEAPFIDVEIAPGADWERDLYHQLERSLGVVLMVTPNWLASKWCFAEFTQARALGKPIFPIIETAAEGPLIAPEIQHLNLIRDREGGLERLLGELERIRLDTQGGFPFPPGRSPFPGLRSFDEDDAAIYFGRDEEIRRLRELLRARRSQGGSQLVLILGSSGSGKSSLMRAGILPRIKREPDQWILVGPFRPLDRPVEQLAISLTTALDRSKSFDEVRALLDAEDRQGIDILARDLRLHVGQPNAFVLIAIDQGEELFSLANAEERRLFLTILTQIGAGNQPALALMTYRSDFLGLLQSDSALKSDFHDFKVNPLPPARIPEIIRGPAKVADLEVDDRLVLRATQDASDKAALPLLAFALSELYERHGTTDKLILDQYLALGDAARGLNPLENAVRETADRTIDKDALSQGELIALRDAFIPALVRVDANGEYVRKSASWSELPPAAAPLLERLLGARLLTATERDGERVIEVSHEALLRDWPTLRGWLDEEREFLLGKEQLRRDLSDWRDAPSDRRAQALLVGLKLSRARVWLAEQPDKLTEEEQLFIQESIEAADREARQRAAMRRALVWVSLGAAVLLAIAAVFYANQWKIAQAERDKARAALFAVQSQNALRAKRIYDAAGLAHRAMATHSSPATRSAMIQSLLNIPPALSKRGSFSSDDLWRAAWPPLPEPLLVATRKGQVVSLDRGTLDVTAAPAFAASDTKPILALSESPEGSIVLVRESGQAEYVAGGGREGEGKRRIRLGEWIIAADVLADQGLIVFLAENELRSTIARCKLTSGVVELESCELADGPDGSVSAIRIDPTGQTIAFGTDDGSVFLYKTDAESEPLVIQVRGRVLSLAWDATGGRWLAAGTLGGGAGSVAVIDPTTGRLAGEASTGIGVRGLAWNEDSTAIAGTCGDRRRGVCVWSRTETGLTLSDELFGHRDAVQSIVWADGPLISMGLDGNVLKWVPGRQSPVFRSVDAPKPGTKLTDIDVAKKGQRLAVGTADGQVLVLDLEARSPATILRTGFPERIAAVAWDRSARYIATSDDSGRISVWELDDPLPAQDFEVSGERIEAIAWDPEEDRIFASLRDGRIASIYIDTGKVSYSNASHERGAAGLTISADGAFLVTSDTFGELIRWSTDGLEEIDRLPSSMDVVGEAVSRGGLALTSDSRRLAVVGNDGRVLIYDVEASTIAGILETGASALQDVEYSADDSLIAVLTIDDTIIVWATASNEQYATVNLKAVQAQNTGFWSIDDADWQTEEISWLTDERTLAVSTSAGKAALISFDDAAWSAEFDVILKE